MKAVQAADEVSAWGKALFKIPEAATYLGLGKSTLYELIAGGELRPVRAGRSVRLPRSELDRWIAAKIRESQDE